jgi:hypothetical protein
MMAEGISYRVSEEGEGVRRYWLLPKGSDGCERYCRDHEMAIAG